MAPDKAKTPDKGAKAPAKVAKPQETFEKQAVKALKNLAVKSLAFLILVFVLGEAYAFYILRSGNPLMLWLPVFVLVAVLFYKVMGTK